MNTNEPAVRFNDGAAYETLMGQWSRVAGETFLAWLAVPPGLRWLDVGCGNGAFTELVVQRCSPAHVEGIDPSPGQVAYARTRPGTPGVPYRQGDAMALPQADASVDVALMALVIFFVPDPARGVAEMARVTRPGGTVAAYAWDMHGGGFPYDALTRELRAAGHPAAKPPSVDASRLDALRSLWEGAGLTDVQTRQIEVARTFPSFETWWQTACLSESVRQAIAGIGPAELAALQARVRARLPAAADGSVTPVARANAVKGRR